MGGENCENVSQRNSVKTQHLGGTQSKKCQISPKVKIPNHLDVSKRIGIEKSKSFGFYKITASLQFNFWKYPKNIGEKYNPRPAYGVNKTK